MVVVVGAATVGCGTTHFLRTYVVTVVEALVSSYVNVSVNVVKR